MERLIEKGQELEWIKGHLSYSCTEKCEEVNGECWRCDILYCMEVLADYEDAEEQGRLIELPFAYGNTIFEIESINDRILEWEVHGYDISPHAIYIKVGEHVELNIAHVGETIFRTRAEAEAKLKEIENQDGEEYRDPAYLNEQEAQYHIESVAYEGDNIWTEDRFKKHSVKCYEHFQHTWVIHNQGTVQWHQRKLVCTNIDEISPKISDTVIQLPDIPPNGYKKITTDIDARGCEGHFISKWDMQDSSGNNCFPRSRSLFDISIDVTFDPLEQIKQELKEMEADL